MNTEDLDKHYAALIEEAENFFVNEFVRNDAIDTAYKNVIDITFNITKTIGSSEKGALVFAKGYGQGKSFIFDVINHIYRRKTGRYFFKITTAKELCLVYTSCPSNEDPEKKLREFINCKNLMIDDIGDEDKKVVYHYSNSLNVMRFVILERYKMWTGKKRFRTFGTTNLTGKEIAAEYGGRAADRLHHMCERVDFSFFKDGGSFRKVKTLRMLTRAEIKENWGKLFKKTAAPKVDILAYVNELLTEEVYYLNADDWSRWGMVRDFMVERGYLKKDADIPIEVLEHAKTLAVIEKKKHIDVRLKHAGTALQVLEKAKANIDPKRFDHIASCLMARKEFMRLRKDKNFKFK